MSDPSNVLAGQRALVTGASSGIGVAVAKALAAAGASVAVSYSRDDAGAARTVGEIESAHGRAASVSRSTSGARRCGSRPTIRTT